MSLAKVAAERGATILDWVESLAVTPKWSLPAAMAPGDRADDSCERSSTAGGNVARFRQRAGSTFAHIRPRTLPLTGRSTRTPSFLCSRPDCYIS